MPEKATIERARRKAKQGKAPTTQAGEFVREEIHHIREGKHGARNAKQAIAIGLSKARRAGVKLPPAPGDDADSARQSKRTPGRRPSRKRAAAVEKALRKEPRSSASHRALSRQAHRAASRRSASSRHAAAMKGVRTKGAAGRHRAAKKAAATRSRSAH